MGRSPWKRGSPCPSSAWRRGSLRPPRLRGGPRAGRVPAWPPRGGEPQAGPILTLEFKATGKGSIAVEISELLDAAGRPFPYVLSPDAVEVGP